MCCVCVCVRVYLTDIFGVPTTNDALSGTACARGAIIYGQYNGDKGATIA